MSIALYARKSIEREGSISCETQLRHCKCRILPEEQSKTVHTFVDNGYSGANTDRKAFKEMMQKVTEGSISKIIIYRLDRISRSLSDFVKILDTLKKYNVTLISTQESFDTNSSYGEMVVKILMVFAEFERNSIVSRVKQSYAHRSLLGFYMGGKTPYGFSLEQTQINGIKTKKLCQNPTQADTVMHIYKRYAQEGATLGVLLRELTQKGSLDSSAKWSTSKLSALLKNPIYVKADSSIYSYFANKNANISSPPQSFDGIHGLQLYGKTNKSQVKNDLSHITVVLMAHDGIIDSHTWLKCQEKLARNKQIKNAVSNQSSWLSGKVVCQSCGRTMTTVKGKVSRGETRIYFNCTGKSHTRICEGHKTPVYAQSLEALMLEQIHTKLSEIPQVSLSKPKSLKEQNCIRNEILFLEQQQSRLADAIASGKAGSELLEMLSVKAQSISSQKKALLEQQKALEISVDTSYYDLAALWEKADNYKRKEVLYILCKKISVYQNGDVEIVWKI